MTIDDITKVILILSISFAIVGIAIYIMRLLSSVTDLTRDFRKTAQNIGDITEQAVQDYEEIGEQIRAISGFLSNFRSTIVDPLNKGLKFVRWAQNKRSNSNSKD